MNDVVKSLVTSLISVLTPLIINKLIIRICKYINPKRRTNDKETTDHKSGEAPPQNIGPPKKRIS
jgi:hypothetical protein